MSIYKFQDSEPVANTTSTGVVGATDPMLIFSGANSRTAQSSVGVISAVWAVTSATTTTTGTAISNFGYTILGSTASTVGTSPQWTIGAPIVGVLKTIRCSSTSTFAQVTSGSTAITFNSTGANNIAFNGVLAYVDLIGVDATHWHVTAQSSAGVSYSTF